MSRSAIDDESVDSSASYVILSDTKTDPVEALPSPDYVSASDTNTEPLEAPASPDYTTGLDTESKPSEIDRKESEEDLSKEDPIEDNEPLSASTAHKPPIQPSPFCPVILVRPGQEIPLYRPYRTHYNGVRRMLTLRKMVHPPFTLLPAIEAVIAEEIAASPGERYRSPFLSSPSPSPSPSPSRKRCRSPSLPPAPSDMLLPRKRVRMTSPYPDPTDEATIKAILARL
ncbi:hypothetical protein Tco_0744985 [Tanacetum coccineum]